MYIYTYIYVQISYSHNYSHPTESPIRHIAMGFEDGANEGNGMFIPYRDKILPVNHQYDKSQEFVQLTVNYLLCTVCSHDTLIHVPSIHIHSPLITLTEMQVHTHFMYIYIYIYIC